MPLLSCCVFGSSLRDSLGGRFRDTIGVPLKLAQLGQRVRMLSMLSLLGLMACRGLPAHEETRAVVVYQSDFGTRDGAVSAMKGVARQVDPTLVLDDLSHGIEPFNVWEASWRLRQTAPYWPKGTVFVSVVDPGVGTERRSVVALSKDGYYFVTPDNGTLALVGEVLGIEALREIDGRHRMPGSEGSATFDGRDVYSYTGALLAAGRISFEEVGRALDSESYVRLEHKPARIEMDGERWTLHGMVSILDPNFGNVWTNVPRVLYANRLEFGMLLNVSIHHGEQEIYRGTLPYSRTFGDVEEGEALAYANSLGELAFALNQGSFASTHGISAGMDWRVVIQAARPSGQ